MPVKKMPKLGAEQAVSIVSDQWFILVVHALMNGKLRYAKVHRAIPGVSKKMLTQTLRKMERDGIVKRTTLPVVPPHTEYELTVLADSLVPTLQQLCRWARSHVDQIEEHRRLFDELAEIKRIPNHWS